MTFVNAQAVLPVIPVPSVFFGGIGPKDFRDVYEFSVKYECDRIKAALDTLIAECLQELKATSDGTRLNESHNIDKIVDLLTSIHLPLMGVSKTADALKPEWRIPFLEAVFDDNAKLSPDPRLDIEGFAKKFKTAIAEIQTASSPASSAMGPR